MSKYPLSDRDSVVTRSTGRCCVDNYIARTPDFPELLELPLHGVIWSKCDNTRADGAFLIMLHKSSKCIIMVLVLFPRGTIQGEIK